MENVYYYFIIIIIVIIIIIIIIIIRKATLKYFEMVSIWKKKKRKTSKFVDAGSNNWNGGEGN